jgi:hypothetical protein
METLSRRWSLTGAGSSAAGTRVRFRPRLATLLLALFVAALAFASCRAQPAAGGWKMKLAMAPSPPSSAGNTTFTLRVTGAAGRPVNGGTASLDLVMTTMDMGPNHVVLAGQGAGIYTGRGAFLMAGPWRCQVTFAAAGRTQKQSFAVQVR